MKKVLLSLLACAGIGFTANAQLARGTVAPDFTLTDINGTSHHLYNYLDSGYTVILDISAAWCGPCWNAHQSHVFENLTDHYGPNGTITPKKIKVIFIEGESGNTTAQLYGPTGGSGVTFTQGDWVTGSNYPIIDNSTLNSQYNLGGYPTFTIICRDHLVVDAPVGYGTAMGQESWWLDIINGNGGCPNYAPSATLDAKTVPYSGANYFICNPTPTVKFQNYSQTSNLTSATVEILNGASVVATQNWTGNLAPYAVGSVTFPTFATTQFAPYKFRITAAGDSYAANNNSDDSLFKVFTAANANTVPYTQNFETLTDFPVSFGAPIDGNMFVVTSADVTTLKGADGMATNAVVANFYNMTANTTTELFIGGYNTAAATHVSFDFDVAYAQYTAATPEQDKLEVMVSTNCGANWTTVWSKTGDNLKTHAPVAGQFIPTAATDWRHEAVNLDAYKNSNMLLKIKGTSDYGNFAWMDNLKVATNLVGINDVVAANTVKVYPNPATDVANVSFNVTNATNVQISVLDATGRTVSQVANEFMNTGDHNIRISTANLAAGVYNVKIQTESGSRIERLSVVK